MLFFKKKNPIQDFWAWFEKNDQRLFHAPAQGKDLQELWERLQSINEHLTYECGQESVAPRELVLSADGIKEGFSFVESLADAAPKLANWKFIRFRPRVNDYASHEIVMHGKRIKASDVEFVLVSDGTLLGISLYIPGCEHDDDREFASIGFILADGAIGEYDMECKVGAFRVLAWDSLEDREHRQPFADLRQCFDEAFERLCTKT